MGALFGGSKSSDKAAELSRQQAASAQRRQLADLARQQAEVDQAKASGGAQKGRRLLTFVDSQATLGGASDGSSSFGSST